MTDYKLTWRFLGHYDPQKAVIGKEKKKRMSDEEGNFIVFLMEDFLEIC